MLKINLGTDGKYVCNWCNKPFDIKDAWNKKGNQYFCSRDCVLNYSELDNNEKIREGE